MSDEEQKGKNYAGWIGLGLLYMWGCAFMAWMDMWNSHVTFGKVLAFAGLSLVSISGIAIAFYTSSLEEKVKKLEREIKVARGEDVYD